MSDEHRHDESETALRTRALESLLIEKGLITAETIDALVSAYEHDIGPLNGAQVVARAWCDEAYRERLLNDGAQAIRELGFGGREGAQMVVLENTPKIHNVVVCTLCSCYPWPVLGLPPSWYKSYAYRSRVVKEPRAVLAEFGLELADSVEVRVWDSNSDVRYMVLPERPRQTVNLTQAQLAELVTRDAMIGVTKVPSP
ncbi:MAG: nitrile hydratase subunit alpha [Gammaproteobacteria bacterium]|nr:nitrile hydratase subunit alpha [Gammaproteobacteria bacterium]